MDRPSDFWRNLIRDLMAERGMSLRELHRLTGMDRKAVSRFLQGRTVLPVDKLEIILALFGLELDAFPRRRAA